jgi:tetratricopeptide (TPR) repeat protein
VTPSPNRLRERFDADPSDRAAFEGLEEAAFVAGDWSALIHLYEAHLAATGEQRTAPERARLLFRMAQAIEEIGGDPARAVAVLRDAAALDPGFDLVTRKLRELATTWNENAEQSHDATDPGVAVDAFERALGVAPDEPRALAGMAHALERAGRAADAAETWERALGVSTGAQRDAALEALARLAAGPLGDPDRALALLRHAGESAPAEPRWIEARFALLRDLGRHAEAAALGPERIARCADPRARAAIALEIGRLHLDVLGAPREAREWLERATEASDDGLAFLALAEAAGRSGDASSRTYYLERAMELGAEIPAWSDLGLDDGATDLDALRRRMEERPDDADALEALAAALAARGEDAERVALLTRHAEHGALDPAERAELWLEIGDIHGERLHAAVAAAAAYRRAIAVDPERALGIDALETSLRHLGRLHELADAFAPILEVAAPARRVSLLCRIGAADLERGDPAAAGARFRAALEVDSSCGRAVAGLRRIADAGGDDAALFAAWAREAETAPLDRLAALGTEALTRALASGDPERAMPVVGHWSTRANTREAHEALATLLEECGRTEELAEALDALVPHLDSAARAANRRRLGYLHGAEGRTDDAIAAWSEALALDPTDLASFGALAEALTEASRDADLIALFEAHDASAAHAPHVASLYALALERVGRHADAAQRLAALVASGSADDTALEAFERNARARGDDAALAEALARRSALCTDRAARAALDFERAALLEADGSLEEIEALHRGVERDASDPHMRASAAARVDALLERRGDFAALADRLAARAAAALPADAAVLHERVASLCETRLCDPIRARAELERAVALDASRATWWRRLAALCGDDAAARRRAWEGELALACEPARAVALQLELARIACDHDGDLVRAERAFRAVLAIDPANQEASAFVAIRLESEGRFEELAALWRDRLAVAGASAAQRIEFATLLADRLERFEEAAATLETALADAGPVAPVVVPLAALYARQGREAERAALCESAAAHAGDPATAARFWSEAAAAHAACGEETRAAQALRHCLGADPSDEAARAALIALLRRGGDDAGLVALLEHEIDRPGRDALALHSELALRCAAIHRDADACTHALAAARLAPHDESLREPALARAIALGQRDAAADLLRAAAEDPRSHDRAALWRRCGEMLEPAAAVDAFAASLEIDPAQPALRSARRAWLESLDRVPEALAVLEQEFAEAPATARAEIAAHAADLAEQACGAPAARTWLARLCAEEPDDAALWIAIAARWGHIGDFAAQERSLAQAERCCEDRVQAGLLACERAALLEGPIAEPARARVAYERARTLLPAHAATLAALDRLYTTSDRRRELLQILAERAGHSHGAERGAILERAARCAESLGEVETAARLWEDAVAPDVADPATAEARLAPAIAAQARAGRIEAQAALFEQALQSTATSETAAALQRELAGIQRDRLGRADRAVALLRCLVDARVANADDRAALFDLLRAQGAHGELAERLAVQLRDTPDDAKTWQELATLREERLWDASGAAEAWRAVARLEPSSAAALAGLRRAAERTGDARALDAGIEREIALGSIDVASAWRRLGRLRRDVLRDLAASERAFAAALAVDASDLVARRALRELAEARGDWSCALDHCEEEIERMDAHDVTGRRALWLHVAERAAGPARDLPRAVAAYERADALGALAAPALATWAAALRTLGDIAVWRRIFARWCDHADAKTEARDHLLLAQSLADVGRAGEARARLDAVFEREPDAAPAWALLARLRDEAGDAPGSSEAWCRAARASVGLDAARAWRAAASAWETTEPERALGLLEEAVQSWPAFAPAHAARARLAERLGRYAEAIEAATRALDERGVVAPLARDEHLGAAVAGARAAHALARWDAAWQLSSEALALAPDERDALVVHGMAALALGSPGAARRSLEAWLANAPEGAAHAEALTALADALRKLGDPDAACARYEAALALDATFETAHAGHTELLETAGRAAEAARAFARWAEVAPTPAQQAERWVRAARLATAEQAADAEDWLCAALVAVPEHARAWLDWTERLDAAGRPEEAFAAATEGAALVVEPQAAARLELRRALTLEARGDAAQACRAFERAAALDPSHDEAAFAAARLLRARGDWQAAASCLGDTAARHPDGRVRAALLAERGRLLAGPLEDVAGAIEAYRRALELAPDDIALREARAGLLAHAPDTRAEARAELLRVLASDPVRPSAWRRLVALLRDAGETRDADRGLALLVALGAATRAEREQTPLPIDFAIGADGLDDPLAEQLRETVLAVAGDWAEALGDAGETIAAVASQSPIARCASAWNVASGEIAGPALARLPVDHFAATAETLLWTALGAAATVDASPETRAFVDRFSARALRRLRRALSGVEAGALRRFDFVDWARALRGLALARAVDRCNGDLRAALECARAEVACGDGAALPVEADLTPIALGAGIARELVSRAVRAWIRAL